jgi:large subunit ribosomal protein L28
MLLWTQVFKEVSGMAKCSVCGKGVVFGNTVSHSHRKTNRAWKPNIRKVKVSENGTIKTVSICARCLRTMKKAENA